MKALLKKEFLLCLHPTAFLFLLTSALVFVPNYPYEVIFFFSGLSVFFLCTRARENGDLMFTGPLPVQKWEIPLARLMTAVLFQCALLGLTAIFIFTKQMTYPADLLIDLAGNSSNLAFCGFGGLLLGIFNLIFFPLHYRSPNQVGVPFVLAAAVQFLTMGILIAIRFLPFFAPIASPDFQYVGAKLAVLLGGSVLYCGLTALAARLTVKAFEKVDL